MEEQNISKSEQERLERSTAARNRKIKKLIVWFVVLAVIAGGIYGLIVWNKNLKANLPGEEIAVLEDPSHIQPDQSPEPPYNSNPPTSGQHYAAPADAGFYDEQLPDGTLIHNLEHGHVWISYRDSGDEQLKQALRDLANEYSWKLVITHRPENDSRAAAAAWGRLLKLEEFDRAKITEFIEAFTNRGPEQTPF